MFREAIAAIHRLIAARLKWNFRRLSAGTARDGIHFTRSAASTVVSAAVRAIARAALPSAGTALSFTRRATRDAAVRFVLKTFGGEKLLLAGAENESGAAIGAGQMLVGIQSESPRCFSMFDSLRTMTTT